MTQRQFRPGEQHPEEYRNDLNPNAMKGQNNSASGPHPEKDARTAYDIKDLHRIIGKITDDNLKQIPVLETGTRLEQGATYVDLRDPARKEFTARADMEAGEYNWYVPKSEVDYQLWNEITGVNDAPRLGEDDEV